MRKYKQFRQIHIPRRKILHMHNLGLTRVRSKNPDIQTGVNERQEKSVETIIKVTKRLAVSHRADIDMYRKRSDK